jgi:5-methylcytosine-specific restriction endonuclease McrA
LSLPEPEAQVQFLFKIQRLLSEGGFVATYKYALLLSLAELAVERGDDSTEQLELDTLDLAEKFVSLYWRQVVPWVPRAGTEPGLLHQITGGQTAVLRGLQQAHERFAGSLPSLRQDQRAWRKLLRRIAQTIEVMPLWRLQTVGRQQLDFLYPNTGRGKVIRLRGDAVYCLRRFHGLVGDLVRSAWVRFIRGLPRNRPLLGETGDLSQFLFGSDRSALASFRELLLDLQAGRCFYCDRSIRDAAPAVDHFIPWSRYPMDLGENLVVADERCNSWKSDMLAATDHLARWRARNAEAQTGKAFAAAGLPHDGAVVERVAFWAYSLAEKTRAQLWVRGREELAPLDAAWRTRPFAWP